MTNINDIFRAVAPFIKGESDLVKGIEVDDISESLQDAKKHEIVFYRLRESGKAWEDFLDRYKTSEHGLLVLYGAVRQFGALERCLVIDESEALSCKKLILDILYPLKKDGPKLVGITGTNGKTTTAHLALRITSLMGKKGLSVGTLGVLSSEGQVERATLTTPSLIDLRKIIYKYQESTDVFFLEVSSHGLDQGRMSGLQFNWGAWTNFTQDHLDYHDSMESYFYCKTLIFDYLKKGKLFRPFSESDLEEKLNDFPAFSTKCLSDWDIINLPPLFLEGFNRKNLELALQLNESLWGPITKLDLHGLDTPRGRFSRVQIGGKLVIIDYAHTPDALENITKELKSMYPERPLGVVFGCGGDRDRKKRSVMGSVTASCLDPEKDSIYVTSDNPRTENPLKIMDDILGGLQDYPKIYTIVERKEAILKALSLMEENGVLLIAGKGHENYQEIKGVRYSFCDFKVVDEFKNRRVL
ncbi:UDP-N-acetylmuramoyl-L-alanyl-D-glutamate--2,6-diaminopimelate ligase [Bacteriovoracales bacterium]|nr:UDP-N-acetylmuramoyl-L-alanyl-D-glutamate--2,6-diaminopimelate ligase [Bacteriovoracales bacterium]